MTPFRIPPIPILRLEAHLQSLAEDAPLPSASAFRGVTARALRRQLCLYPERPRCQGCLLQTACLHARLLEPAAPPADRRPFDLQQEPPLPLALVVIPGAAQGTAVLRLTLIGLEAAGEVTRLLQALAEGVEQGLGALARRPWRLLAVTEGHGSITTDRPDPIAGPPPLGPRITSLGVQLLSPLKLMQAGRVVRPQDLDAPLLVLTALRRVSLAAALYTAERVEGEFALLKLRLEEEARLQAIQLTWREGIRESERAGRMPLGGITGSAILSLGDLAAVVWPILWWGSLLQIGKGTALGCGAMAVAPALAVRAERAERPAEPKAKAMTMAMEASDD